MSNIAKPTKVLSASEDYTHALRSANEIDQAVNLVAKGNKIADFPLYIKKYNELLESVVATHDVANKNPKLVPTHYELVKKLEKIDKRVEIACAKMGIKPPPPSKELIQMLKVDKTLSQKSVSQWTWTRLAPYIGLGAGVVVTAPLLLSLATKLPPFGRMLFHGVPKIAETAITMVNQTTTTAGAQTPGDVVRDAFDIALAPSAKVPFYELGNRSFEFNPTPGFFPDFGADISSKILSSATISANLGPTSPNISLNSERSKPEIQVSTMLSLLASGVTPKNVTAGTERWLPLSPIRTGKQQDTDFPHTNVSLTLESAVGTSAAQLVGSNRLTSILQVPKTLIEQDEITPAPSSYFFRGAAEIDTAVNRDPALRALHKKLAEQIKESPTSIKQREAELSDPKVAYMVASISVTASLASAIGINKLLTPSLKECSVIPALAALFPIAIGLAYPIKIIVDSYRNPEGYVGRVATVIGESLRWLRQSFSEIL